MVLNKSSKYQRDYNKIKRKHQKDILENIEKIESLMIFHKNFSELMKSHFYKIYHFEKLSGDRKDCY